MKKKNTKTPSSWRVQSVISNAIAISGDLHADPKYDAFYKRVGERLNGFTGIFDLVERLADALTDWEELNGKREAYSDGPDWIEVVEAMVAITFEDAERLGDTEPAADVVARAIKYVTERAS